MPPTPQARYWILTIPAHAFTPFLPRTVTYIRGQLERGDGGFLHWQLVAYFDKRIRLSSVIDIFGPYHAEPTKSDAALQYVWKEDTRVDGTQFELGEKSFNRNSPKVTYLLLTLRIGVTYSQRPSWAVISWISRPTWWCDVILNSDELPQISQLLNHWNDVWSVSGGQLAAASLDVHGMRPLSMLTLKIQGPNSGTDIEVKQMLSSMNLEVKKNGLNARCH